MPEQGRAESAAKAKQGADAEEVDAIRPKAEATVWTDRMVSALVNGVKGGRWFSLIDKVTALATRVTAARLPLFRISGVAGTGVDRLLEAVWQQIAAVRESDAAAAIVDEPIEDGVDLITPGRARRDL